MSLSQRLQDRIITDNIKDFVPLTQGVILAQGKKLFGVLNTYNVKVINGNHLLDTYQSYEVLTNVAMNSTNASGAIPASLKEGDAVLIGYLNGDKNSPYIINGGASTSKSVPNGASNFLDDNSNPVDTSYGDIPTGFSTTITLDVDLDNADVRQILNNLPSNLSSTRRTIVESALGLVGEVDYFWGGRWHNKGVCNEWGQHKQVTAPGSKTSGTMQPYGLDCSGFTDWAYYQAGVDLKGFSTWGQIDMGTIIAWSSALPGDLVFNDSGTHVGIYVGTDASGEIATVDAPAPGKKISLGDKQSFTRVVRINGVH